MAQGAVHDQLLGRPAGGDADVRCRLQVRRTVERHPLEGARIRQAAVGCAGRTDEGKRKQYLWTMQAMLHENGGALIPVFRDWLDAHNQKVGGHTPHGGYDMNNGWIMEDAWLKS